MRPANDCAQKSSKREDDIDEPVFAATVHERSGVIKRVFPFTSLQILTQEDWNVVLYNGMASTSSWAALYFVALMTFGNYVLFNLLVAILVEGFQAEVRDLSRRRAKTEKHVQG